MNFWVILNLRKKLMTRARKGVDEVQRTHFLSRRSRWHHQLGVEEFDMHLFLQLFVFLWCTYTLL